MGSGLIDWERGAFVGTTPWLHIEYIQFLRTLDAARISINWPTSGWKYLKHSDAVLPDGTSKRKFQPLADQFPDIAEEVLSSAMKHELCESLGVEGNLYPQAPLIEDAPGYWIRKHTDCAGKVISAQCYFPDEGAPEAQGVVLEPDWQIPYRFNYGYAFKVSKHSWHRVRPSPMRRRSLQLIYYDTPNPKL